MGLFTKAMTLHEMEKILAKRLREENRSIRKHRIIGDLDLTCEDYKTLTERLKDIQQYRYDITVLEHYKLCMITSWIFALRYEREENFIYEEIKGTILELPQHIQRRFMELCESAFTEYGIQHFGIDTRNLDGLLANLAIHAGIPNQLLSAYVAILEDSLQYDDKEMFKQNMINNMSGHMREIYRYIDEENLMEMLEVTRNVYKDCQVNQMDRDAVFKKYQYTSKQIIEACINGPKRRSYAKA